MDDWEEYNKTTKNIFSKTAKQKDDDSEYYLGYLDEFDRDNMSPKTYDECLADTTASINLKKWTYVFEICCIVAFVLLCFAGFGSVIDNSYVVKTHSYGPDTEEFNIGIFLVGMIVYGIVLFLTLLSIKLTCAVLNCLAQISRNTGISAKLAAYNTRNQIIKEAKEEREKQV